VQAPCKRQTVLGLALWQQSPWDGGHSHSGQKVHLISVAAPNPAPALARLRPIRRCAPVPRNLSVSNTCPAQAAVKPKPPVFRLHLRPELPYATNMTVDVLIEDARWAACDLARLAETAARATLSHLCLAPDPLEIALLACDDARIAALNADFRGKPTATNVLSWPSGPWTPATLPADGELGDIAIAFDTCASETDTQGKSLTDHATHLIIHATLHLLGFDHETDAEAAEMERLEVEILARLGLADPYRGAGA
jgi:probable rRNA maturation factor